MKVKLLISRAGPAGAFGPGDVIEVGDAEAVRMFEAGQAVPVRTDDTIETTAASGAAETAAKGKRKGK